MQKLKENSLDFFKQSKIEQFNTKSNIHVIYAMFLYTMYKIFNIKILVKLAFLGVFIYCVFGAFQYFSDGEKKDEAMQAVLFKENVENVSKISQSQINETLVFLDNARNKEINRLTQLYWIVKYIDSKGNLDGNIKYAINDIQKAIVETKDHYANRKLELVQTYNLVQQKKYNFLTNSYDDKNALSIVVALVNANNMKADYVTADSAKLIQKFMAEVNQPEELNVYLANNKEKMKQEFVIFEK